MKITATTLTQSEYNNNNNIDLINDVYVRGDLYLSNTHTLTIGNTSITENQLASVVEVLANIIDATGVSF